MKHSFTLVESLITIFIIGILTAVSAAGYASYKKRTNFDDSVGQLKSAILATQNLAFVPDNTNALSYVFILNANDIGGSNISYGGISLTPHSYGIFRVVSVTPFTVENVSKSQINGPIGFTISANDKYLSSGRLAIFYRVEDGAAGCLNKYYDNSDWSVCSDGGDYLEIKLTDNRPDQTSEKTIKIQKATGSLELQ